MADLLDFNLRNRFDPHPTSALKGSNDLPTAMRLNLLRGFGPRAGIDSHDLGAELRVAKLPVSAQDRPASPFQ